MTETLPIIELFHQTMPPRRCSYLPTETAALEYRVLAQVGPEGYADLLSRGWRRHGWNFFRPACPDCVKCRSLRVDVERFRPTKSQRRTLRRNADIRLVVQSPTVTEDHVRLYNEWHTDMTARSGWREQTVDAAEYHEAFLMGDWEFAREFLYYRGDRLLGVGLVDEVPGALSSIYFFHDPIWRDAGPGTFTVLQEIEYARRTGRRYLYMGYWIAECQSMAYKNRFGPHEVLESYPREDESPIWTPADE